ncbi:hypothetical protein [Microvirga roseola]|uniref:hypothetical protein n=1 Tax=Microvirga roseola TaxID=2883126 RepID=UPI001E3794C5|nr:hypothetical protein [Microvirga roseola]
MEWDIADGWVWALVVIGGPLLIGIFMFVYGRRRRLNRVEREAAREGTRENWGKERIH